jgi:ribosomal protein S6--L-glutamate ligase
MNTVWILTDARYLEQRMPLALCDWLAERAPIRLLIAEDVLLEVGMAPPRLEDPLAGLRPGDALVARTRHPFGLALLSAAQRPGVAVLTPGEAVTAVRSKPEAAVVLAGLGIPTPPTFLAEGLRGLEAIPDECFPLILKPHLGDNAVGIVVARDRSELHELAWDDGMVLAQRFVDTGGVDTKVYVAGERVWAVRRPSPLCLRGAPGRSPQARSVRPGAELERLARRCAEPFGLELYGIDVLESADGPLVVDVNDFPNYTGVPEAPEAIGRMALARLAEGVAA